MRDLACSLFLFGLVAGVCSAQSLDGRVIVLDAGDHISRDMPVALPYDAPAPEGRVSVVEAKTGKSFPATVRGGRFVFVPEGAMPNTTHVYKVQVHTDTRPPKVLIKKKSGASELDVFIEDKPFTVYHYSNDNKKPFLWPVYGEGEVTVTRNWPMGPTEGHDDHEHHKSIWTAYGNLNGTDWWGEGEGSGRQRSDEVTWASGEAYGWIHAKNTWLDKEGQPVVDEEREYRFYTGPPEARIFDATITFTASYGDVLFGDTKEGGIMALRIRPEIEGNRNGAITNAAGQKGEKACWGKPSPWCDYAGMIEGVGVRGIAIFDHPSNLRHPTRWHVRDYGLNGANCFGLSRFTHGKENGDYTLKEGEKLTFRYRVLVHSEDAGAARVADRYADYATPPKVRWQEP